MMPPLSVVLFWGAVVVLLVVLAQLSQRLGLVTHARPHYRWYYGAALLVMLGVGIQFVQHHPPLAAWLNRTILGVILMEGLPALGLTLGLTVTWYYWSWLLAERD